MSKAFRVLVVAVVIAALGLLGGQLGGAALGQGGLKGKIALVLDVGGRGDLSFNDMGFKGADEAVEAFGLELTEIQSATAADYLPNLTNAARSGEFDLIVAVGFLLTDALNQVAEQFPDQKFAIIDSVVDQPNVQSIVFNENEGSALVGAVGAMVAAHYGFPNIGVVLGIEIPVLYHFEAGYRFGLHWGNAKYAQVTGTDPDVGLLWTYTGTFSDIAKGKAASQAMLQQGAGLIYNVAGPLGIGDLEAITEFLADQGKQAGPPFMIGVDANQDYLGDGHRVLISMMKRVDVGVFRAIESVVNGTFQGGLTVLGLKNRGIAVSRYQDLLDFIEFGIAGGAIQEADRDQIIQNWLAMREAVPYFIWDALGELESKIVSGEIEVPTANSLDEIQQVRTAYPDN